MSGNSHNALHEWYGQNIGLYSDLMTVAQRILEELIIAWAEIHYSRGYKFSGVLPRHVNRRLYCLAGALELADMNFAALEREVDDYREDVMKRVDNGDLDIEINSTSLLSYLSIRLQHVKLKQVEVLEDDDISRTVIDELENFGILSLSDLNSLLNDEFLESVAKHQGYTTYAGTLRDAMIFSDIDRYLSIFPS